MLRPWWIVFAVACGSSSPPTPAVGTPVGASSPGAERRCLPVVAAACGCVYTCGLGVRDGDHWRVTHPFWKGSELRAKIAPWCVAGSCTDVFSAEVVCDGICAPKPADPQCVLAADDYCGPPPA